MPRPHAASLPLADQALRVLIVLNVLGGVAIGALLAATFINETWAFTALGVPPSPETRGELTGMRMVAVLGIAAVPLNHVVLARLRAMVRSVLDGESFAGANAARLRAIAWSLLALQLLSVVIGAIGHAVSTPAHPLHLDAGFSPGGWLAVLMAFVLERVFAEGTTMRDDLAGTV